MEKQECKYIDTDHFEKRNGDKRHLKRMRLIFENKSIEIPADQPLILGRNKLLEIADQRISRRQVSVYYNASKDEFELSVLVPNANVKLNGNLLKFQEPIKINDQDILSLYNDSYCVKFSTESESATPEATEFDDEVSDESSDVYDFEIIIPHSS